MISRYFLLLLTAYLIGSCPTALMVSKGIARLDIRLLGDRNMGARNTQHVFGWQAGFWVAFVDFFKGFGAVALARWLRMDMSWQMLAGATAVIGHDFPLFANFKGGQGMAASAGTMCMLFFQETLMGLLAFAFVYLLTRHFDFSASIGFGLVVFLLVRNLRSYHLVLYSIVLLLMIPVKKYWDSRHRYSGGM
jgi:glycerol-3-phosphate acyltransferase PlsY